MEVRKGTVSRVSDPNATVDHDARMEVTSHGPDSAQSSGSHQYLSIIWITSLRPLANPFCEDVAQRTDCWFKNAGITQGANYIDTLVYNNYITQRAWKRSLILYFLYLRHLRRRPLHYLRRLLAPRPNLLPILEENERYRCNGHRNQRKQEPCPLESHVVEHLVDKKWYRGADLGPQERLCGNGRGSEGTVRVDDVRICGDVDEDHGKAKNEASNADTEPVHPGICASEGEDEEGDGKGAIEQ